MLLFHSESWDTFFWLEQWRSQRQNQGKKYQHSAFSSKLFFSEERQVLQGPSAAFKLTAIMGTNTQNPLLNRMDNYACTSELPRTLPASGVRLIGCRLDKFGHQLVTVAQKFWSGCHTQIEARWTREKAWFSATPILEVEVTKSKGPVTHFRSEMVKFSVLASTCFPSHSIAGILVSTSSTNSFFITFLPL